MWGCEALRFEALCSAPRRVSHIEPAVIGEADDADRFLMDLGRKSGGSCGDRDGSHSAEARAA